MKILIIAPYYAPSSEVASVRMVSLSNYLVKQGHAVTVVCWSRKKLLTLYDEKELSSKVPDGVQVVEFESEQKYLPFIDDLRFGKNLKSMLPKLVNLTEYDVIFVTCGPYFTLEAMPCIKERFGIPYILDFRDLGALNYRPKLGTEGNKNKTIWWKQLAKKWYEGKVSERERKAVQKANGVICVSPIDKEKMQVAYNIPEVKLSIATNGFDENMLSVVIPAEKQKGIVGAVFGKFMYYSRERATALLSGIDKLHKTGMDIRLMHIGREYDYIKTSIQENGIDQYCYDGRGLKEYATGMALLGSADFFVVEDTSPDDVGTKIYDYIFWNKPIIAAVPKDIPLAKLVGTFDHGYVCETADEIDEALQDIVNNNYDVLDSKLDQMKYSRMYQNQKMEHMMLKVIAGR